MGVCVTVSLMAWICIVTPHRIRWIKGRKGFERNREPLTSMCECNIQDAFLSAGGREGAGVCVGDWINYVLSPFSWLKSTLLPLDSLCLCLRQPSQMDGACHPMQTLPSLLSGLHFDTPALTPCLLFVALHSSFSVIHLHEGKKKRNKWEPRACCFIACLMICENNFGFSITSYVCQEWSAPPGIVNRISLFASRRYNRTLGLLNNKCSFSSTNFFFFQMLK